MAPKGTLQSYGIEIRKGQECNIVADCPKLAGLFQLILNIKQLNIDRFGGSVGEDHSIHPTPSIQREAELKLEAIELARACSDPKSHTDTEDEWVAAMKPIVFYRFDRKAEEIYTRNRHHYCFLCDKHFPFRSRPLLTNTSSRLYGQKMRGVYGDDKESHGADLCKLHSNISHFEISKVTYLEYEDEGVMTPDLTIGLLCWSGNWYPPPGSTNFNLEKTMTHRLVLPFKSETLKKHLKPLFSIPGKSVAEPPVTFPFAIWEAKKEGGESNPVVQNAVKVKMILNWQQELAKEAKIEWQPLAFHFVSVGSDWKLYACNIEAQPRRKSSYIFRLLWSGDCAEEASALQLLCLVDIIALWGQFQFKPFAGACIRSLQGHRPRRRVSWSRLAKKYKKDQKSIEAKHFRWLNFQQEFNQNPERGMFHLPRAGTLTSPEEIERQIEEGMRLFSLKDYFVPERDGFIWLSSLGLPSSEFMVLRINNEGSVLPPVLVYNSMDWESRDFLEILPKERKRMPAAVQTDFQYDREGTSVLQRCFDSDKGYCTNGDIQFCAFIPLEGHIRWIDRMYFRPLEDQLDIETLLVNVKIANEEWCTCKGPDEGNMIQCDSIKCLVGWYHKECAGLDDDYEAKDWICDGCKTDPSNILIDPDFNDEGVDENIVGRSDMRIQRARSLYRVWESHVWPDPLEIRRSFNRISAAIELGTRESDFRDTVKTLRNEECSRCWAILRDDPCRMTRVWPRFRATEE
ncbi:hypothetical protein BCR34DRAFT_555125 [Clohesyomyces aquaticus]|uniref:Zinc finger PHD-type domain-containing protein n=1 Tax=Clohesyomyces aquaticus TaxID=1231657 RepID=A0A1Y2A5F8_9PLEO|nr:hypothetical protein BCR34DRAFT_555125 [Clohesyomyces aquaticus]